MKKLKITALLAMAGMAVTLTACGSSNNANETTTTSASETTKAADANATTTAKTETTTAKAAKKLPETFTVGEIGESSYKNTFFDINFQAGDGWLVANKDQLAQLTQLTADAVTDDKVKESLESGATRTLFFAQDSSGLNNLNLVSGMTKAGSLAITAEQLINSMLPQLKTTYEAQGYSNVSVTKENVKYEGQEIPAIKIKGQYGGRNIYQTQVVIVNSAYYGILTATSFETDNNQAILDLVKVAN